MDSVREGSSASATFDLKNLADKLFISTSQEQLKFVDANTRRLSIPKNSIFSDEEGFEFYQGISLDSISGISTKLSAYILRSNGIDSDNQQVREEVKAKVLKDIRFLKLATVVLKYLKTNVTIN